MDNMNSKIQQELLNKSSAFLQQASHVLGQTAIHVYGVIVKQQVVIGISELIQFGLAILITGIVFVWYIRAGFKNWKRWANHPDDLGFMYIIGFLIIFAGIGMGSFAALGFLTDSLQHILNPEFFAIQYIFQAAKGN